MVNEYLRDKFTLCFGNQVAVLKPFIITQVAVSIY